MTTIDSTAEYVATEELPKLTVAQFLTDLAKFPPESEIVASIMGSNITIPITQAISITSKEGKELTILLVPYVAAKQGIEYAEHFMKDQESGN